MPACNASVIAVGVVQEEAGRFSNTRPGRASGTRGRGSLLSVLRLATRSPGGVRCGVGTGGPAMLFQSPIKTVVSRLLRLHSFPTTPRQNTNTPSGCCSEGPVLSLNIHILFFIPIILIQPYLRYPPTPIPTLYPSAVWRHGFLHLFSFSNLETGSLRRSDGPPRIW